MDLAVEKALSFSNYQQTLTIQRKVLKEKMLGKMMFAINGGLFKIDRELLVFVQMLLDQGRSNGVVILDNNENPIIIEDLQNFKNEIFDRYFSATLEYYSAYQKIKNSRSIEKLLEL